MSSARYAPLAGPDADQELHAAFESDSEDEEDTLNTAHESTPLTQAKPTTNRTPEDDEPTSSIPGAYDFEREYDYPPPGSPPAPSSRALPNDFGNSNGLLPTTPVRSVNRPRPSFFRRAVGALLPSHYVRIPTHESSHASRSVVGAGIENDGVFANVMAKPQPAQVIEGPDGNVFMVPEDNQKEVPPTYSEAQADAVPPYWETTVHAPASDDPNADMIVDDLPTGSMWLFAINLFISFFFQFIGFLFTYLLHTSHAAKFGSRAGLGLTLIQLGFYSRSMGATDPDTAQDVGAASSLPTGVDKTAPVANDTIFPAVTSRDWLAFLFMTLGWFIFLSSVIGYWRIKRWESSIRAAAAPPAVVTPEQIERDIAIRRNISSVFGMSFTEDEEAQTRLAHARAVQAAEDARLTRDLRAAGLL